MSKTLDVVAELAFVEHLTEEEAVQLPEVLPHARYRRAWQATAEAVLDAYYTDDMKLYIELSEAVIEAAEACTKYAYPYRRKDCDRLDATIEALQEARDE